MSEPFVPFAPARPRLSGNADGFRLTVWPPNQTAKAPAPLVPPPPVPSAITHAPGSHEPKVSVERDGDRVTRIRVECGCGQVIELNCAY